MDIETLELNPKQLEAVTYRGSALLIIAGAGSGKTRVLTFRIADLVRSKDAWPSQILAITFTNKAASEMRERVYNLLGESATGMWISTFHSACVRILRREAQVIGLTSTFTIYDSADQRTILKRIVNELGADTLGITPGSAQAKISKLKNELIDVEAFARNSNPQNPNEVMLLEIFRRYTVRLREAKALDFDDLIAETVYLLRAFPKTAALYQRRFRHILVDEYQDTNHAQYALIRELTRPISAAIVAELVQEQIPVIQLTDVTGQIPGAALTVVGDSDQSIYSFRGADVRNIVEFERDFPGTKVILLEQNYRSTQNILSAANAVISQNFDRKEKNLWTADGDGEQIVGYAGYSGHDEAQFIADEIDTLHRQGHAYRDIAVLYRTNAQTRALEEIFVRQAIPYRIIGGTKFYERAEIKDAIAYLTVVANPFDELALRRILNTPKRGIGSVTETLIAVFADQHEISFREALDHSEELGLGPKLSTKIANLAAVFNDATVLLDPNRFGAGKDTAGNLRSAPVGQIMSFLMEASGLVKTLRKSTDSQDETRAQNVEELIAQTRDFDRENPDATLVDFLTHVALVAAADELDDESGSVSLMTLHTAKGLEYETVFITGLEEGILPHQISVNEPGGQAEERRLFYVGITRARRRLYLSLAMSRAVYGDIAVALPSQFLTEIPESLLNWRQPPRMMAYRSGFRSGAGAGAGAGEAEEWRVGRVRGTGGRGVGRGSLDRGNGSWHRGEQSSLSWAKPGIQREVAGNNRTRRKVDWPNRVTANVRDNSSLELSAGDRVAHADFGQGLVQEVTGEGAKRIAHVQFDAVGVKKLLIMIAPIEKLAKQ